MADADHQSQDNIASHTLAFLRGIDKRQDEFVDLLARQTGLIMRLERNVQEGFEIFTRRFDRVDRDLREVKSDILLLENKLLNRMNAKFDLSRRLERIEERLAIDTSDRNPSSAF